MCAQSLEVSPNDASAARFACKRATILLQRDKRDIGITLSHGGLNSYAVMI